MNRDRDADLATLRAVHAAAERGDFAVAARLAEPALDSGLEHPLLYNVLAIGHEQRGEVEAAAALLGRGVARFPNDEALRNALGLSLLRLERWDAALLEFDALLALAPSLPYGHASRGVALLALGALDRAEASHRRALDIDLRQPVALAGLAQIAVRRGRHREARSLAERALAVLPGYPDAVTTLAAAEIGLGEPAAAAARLEGLLADPKTQGPERAYAHGLLGDARDAGGDLPGAFLAYGAQNEELRSYYAPRFASGPGAREAVEATTAYFEASAAWPAAAPAAADARGHVFVLGFPRSGTTLLEVALEGDPAVLSLGENELLIDGVREYLGGPAGLERLAAADDKTLAELRAAYWSRAREAGAEPAGRVFLDKHPLNTLKLPLIARLFPAANVVFVYRDPRDVVLSCYRRRFQMSAPMYELLTLEGAARFYASVMRLAEVLEAKLPIALARVRYEALVRDFDGEMQWLCAALGIAWSAAIRDFAARTERRAHATPSTAQLARGLDASGIGAWRRYARELEAVRTILEPWVRALKYED
jgi:tetratricopeptide (TPR) repeat protein